MDVTSVGNVKNIWISWISILGVIVLAVFLHRSVTGTGIPIDDHAAAQLYAARHLGTTFNTLPQTYFSGKPLPVYPALLALTAKARHLEPVQAAAGLNGVLMVFCVVGAAFIVSRFANSGFYTIASAIIAGSAASFLATKIDANLTAVCISIACGVGFVQTKRRSARIGVILVCSLLAIMTASYALGVVLGVAALVLLLSRGRQASVESTQRKYGAQVFAALSIIFAVYVTGLRLSSTTRLNRESPYRYSLPAWRESKTIRFLQALPLTTPIYSNDPNAVLVLVNRPASPLPARLDRAWRVWTVDLPQAQSMANSVATAHAVVACFTDEHLPPPPEEALQPYLPPGDWIDLPDAKVFVVHEDPAIKAALVKVHRVGFDPAAAFTPSRRSAGKDKAWLQRHEEFCAIAAKGDIGLLFLGDSITDDVRQEDKVPGGTAFFNERFGPYKPANFGIDHDRTEHLLYRILNGECPSTLRPKVAVILIGTNNAGEDSPEAIAHGVRACVEAVRKQLPQTKVLLMGEFPRSAHADSEKRPILKKVNTLIARLDDGKTIRYLDIYDQFLEPNGDLKPDVLRPDLLHPSLKGYHIWFDAMQPLLQEMMAN